MSSPRGAILFGVGIGSLGDLTTLNRIFWSLEGEYKEELPGFVLYWVRHICVHNDHTVDGLVQAISG